MTVASAEAYSKRIKGHSPERIRDAAWSLCASGLSGVVLDAGSGDGGWLRRLLPEAKQLISVDLFDAGAGSTEGVEFHLSNLARDPLPCATDSVDYVTALEVIEHLANPRHFIAEAFRVLKPQARMLISTPCNDCLTSRLSLFVRGYYPAFAEHSYIECGHITPITELDMRRMSREVGFSNIEFHYPLTGRMPSVNLHWQQILPFLKGKLWSDTMFALLIK